MGADPLDANELVLVGAIARLRQKCPRRCSGSRPVARGRLELRVGGETYLLEQGDVVMFRGDQRHSYHNRESHEVIAYSVIAFAPSGS